MSKKTYTHYAVSIGGGEYLHSGYNCNSEEEVKEELLSLQKLQMSPTDFNKLKTFTVDEICKHLGYKLEGQDYPFEESDYF